ncbi:MAG: hypothetical protein AAFP89_13250 [Bacteroidota bacterium]
MRLEMIGWKQMMKGSICVALAGMLLFFTGCQSGIQRITEEEYQALLKEEVPKGLQDDELFLGLHFGMTSKDFYATCWELNKQEILLAGGANASAQFKPEDLMPKGKIDFYPEFKEGKIYAMPFLVSAEMWDITQKELYAKQYVKTVVQLMDKWYGTEFKLYEDPEAGKILIDVQGSRETRVSIKDDQYVKVTITDLSQDEAFQNEVATE